MKKEQTEIVTMTTKQIDTCISKIKSAEKNGLKSTWVIAENLNNLVKNNVNVDEIISLTHYTKTTISRLSRSFELIESLPEHMYVIIEKYGANTISEILPLRNNHDNLIDVIKKMESREIPYTSKEVRELVKGYLKLEDKSTDTDTDTGTDTGTDIDTSFIKKEFFEYIIEEYNLSEEDAKILKSF